jgi:hypothetical protein
LWSRLRRRAGFASIDLGEGIDRPRLQVALCGYMADGTRPGWPPDWEAAWEEELEGLNLIMLTLALEPEEYDALVQETRRLLEREDVRRLIAALARVLDRVPRVWEPEILSIAKAVGFHPETKGVLPCST